MAKEWECMECGFVHEGARPPKRCPECGAPSEEFELYEYEEDTDELEDEDLFEDEEDWEEEEEEDFEEEEEED
jgi:rubredoxin